MSLPVGVLSFAVIIVNATAMIEMSYPSRNVPMAERIVIYQCLPVTFASSRALKSPEPIVNFYIITLLTNILLCILSTPASIMLHSSEEIY